MPNAENCPYVYVNEDGTARELHPNERQYLQTEFLPGDGAAPHIKQGYGVLNGWGEIRGFLERSKLPPGMPIQAAPKQDPSRRLSKAEYIEWLQSKGVKVTEHSDGSLLLAKPPGE